ncbi:hypothetical protein BC936DRAFT_136556 [Jimgerdemannia flammicorona]|uniref:DNA mismatch repair protein MutS-like N-terminal domain-containing protein n=1 Tax=Jimgerdemannia flammicorona TaxID=994334 RepID=A0A433CZ94_9FUNG|nr:hypothetical protein BC936DRAFT_136556 [Jimgerdemannia flammicorona]
MDSIDDNKSAVPEIDKPEQLLFVKFFRGLPQKPDGTIRLFERDANQKRYYTFHGDDALYIAQNVFKTTSVVKYWGGDSSKGLATCILSHSAADSFLRDALLTRQLRIEIWGADGAKKGGAAWKLTRRASPGNLQDVEDYLFANTHMSAAPIVMAAKLGAGGENKVRVGIVGVSFADASIREIGVAEFVDNELYSNFEVGIHSSGLSPFPLTCILTHVQHVHHCTLQSLIIQLGVKECIIMQDESHKDYELTKLKGVLDRVGVVVTEKKKGVYDGPGLGTEGDEN